MLKKQKVAVLVSGGGTNLQALIDAQASGKMPHCEIKLVISNKPNVYALERARQSGIKSYVVEKKNYDNRPHFDLALTNILEENEIDIIVLAGFLTILGEDFTSRYANRIINIHPSLIPSFCGSGYYGLRVHKAALDYGVKVTGATVHFVNEVPDGGKIILQRAVYINDDDTPDSLQKRVMEEAEWIILPQAVEMVCAERSEKNSEDN